MIPKSNKHIGFILDFHKIIWAKQYWRNQEGSRTVGQPSSPTIYGEYIVEPDEYARPYDIAFPGETRLERARRLDLIDRWIPICEMRTYCRELIRWEGQQALDMYRAYCAFLMSNNNNNNKKKGNKK